MQLPPIGVSVNSNVKTPAYALRDAVLAVGTQCYNGTREFDWTEDSSHIPVMFTKLTRADHEAFPALRYFDSLWLAVKATKGKVQ